MEALCKVSQEEIFNKDPTVFSLQKIVDVAYYNLLCRGGAVWSKLWVSITAHLIKVRNSRLLLLKIKYCNFVGRDFGI